MFSSTRRLRLLPLFAIGFVAGLLAPFASGKEDPPAPPAPVPVPAPEPPPMPPRGSPERTAFRESMWPAPTAKDWDKPVLITWQRTWDDAVQVAKETGKAILVCINMDGEVASEHYAGVRYRQPEITALYAPYVTVIASVYRHNPRDYDDQGRRIPCPRFGGVTCGEHIGIEPIIFEKFCDGQRVAPRHIMVEPDGQGGGKESYDVYYKNDTASVFQAIKDGIEKRTASPTTVVRGDRPLVERVASREVTDRTAVEAAFQQGDAGLRRSLLDAALAHPEAAPLDLLRLAVFGLDLDQSRLARRALAQVDAPAATELIAEALRVPMDAADRDALILALKRLGSSSTLARWLGVVHQGLATRSSAVDAKGWSESPAEGVYPAPLVALKETDLGTHLEAMAKAATERPDDPALQLDLAESYLAMALAAPDDWPSDPRRARMVTRQGLQDARTASANARRLGASGWRLESVAALAAYYAGDTDEGYALSAEAMRVLPPGDTQWTSMAVLTVFAESRWKTIKKAVKEKLDFPPEWLADVNEAYAVLLRHPLGTEEQVLWHQDLMDWLGADAQATRILQRGLARFRDSPAIHERLRGHLLRKQGPDGLEASYAKLLEEKDTGAGTTWFAAAASVTAGDVHRRRGRYDDALAAYARAIPLYERYLAAVPSSKATIAEAVALVLAGRARILFQVGKDDEATAAILASFERNPTAAGTKDGMGITPGETAQVILARLRSIAREDLAARLVEVMSDLDPAPRAGSRVSTVDVRALAARIEREATFLKDVVREIEGVIVGQRPLIDGLLIGLLADGHVLLEGLPGLAKSLAVQTLATALGGTFRRIQFTPDLLPSDLVGTQVFSPRTGDWTVREGPVFANFVLADEINRAPAKVQSALLEAMQERQVTLAGETRPLPTPFLVLATQNPVELEGTYPLPEAQIDRFLLKVVVGYPDREEERRIIDRMAATSSRPAAQRVASPDQILEARALLDQVHVDERILKYVVDVVFATREPEAAGLEDLKPMILYGASPRASIALVRAARAKAFLEGRGFVTPNDIKAVGFDVLRHRLTPTFEAEAEGLTAVEMIRRVFDTVHVP